MTKTEGQQSVCPTCRSDDRTVRRVNFSEMIHVNKRGRWLRPNWNKAEECPDPWHDQPEGGGEPQMYVDPTSGRFMRVAKLVGVEPAVKPGRMTARERKFLDDLPIKVKELFRDAGDYTKRRIVAALRAHDAQLAGPAEQKEVTNGSGYAGPAGNVRVRTCSVFDRSVAETTGPVSARPAEEVTPELAEARETNRELNRRNGELQKALNLETGRKAWYGYYSAAMACFKQMAERAEKAEKEIAELRAGTEQRGREEPDWHAFYTDSQTQLYAATERIAHLEQMLEKAIQSMDVCQTAKFGCLPELRAALRSEGEKSDPKI
jgi:hypothetical protein